VLTTLGATLPTVLGRRSYTVDAEVTSSQAWLSTLCAGGRVGVGVASTFITHHTDRSKAAAHIKNATLGPATMLLMMPDTC